MLLGEALVLGPNINLPMQEDAAGASPRGGREGSYARLQGDPARAGADCGGLYPHAKDADANRAPLDAAYALAMEKVAAQFPDDNEIAVLYANR